MSKFCNNEIIDFVFSEINKSNDGSEPIIKKSLIEDIIDTQSRFTVAKMKEGTFETVIYKHMGKIKPRHKKLQKMNHHKIKKNGKNN